MGQLNHCGNGVLDGWLWISGEHRVAVSHVSELSEEFSIQGFETSSAQGLLTDRAGGYVYDPQEQRAGLWFNLNKHIRKEMRISYSIWAKQRRLNARKRQTLLKSW